MSTNTETSGLKFKSTRPEGASTTFQNPSNWNKAGKTGNMVTGVYEGKTETNPVTGKEDFKFKALDSGTTINKELKEIGYAAGTSVVVNNSGNLSYKIENYVKIGDVVQIQYEGLLPILSGPRKGKESHSFDVLVASEASAG